MSNPMCWYPFDEGRSIGQVGSESGRILRDEEYSEGSRITLEQGGSKPFSITCGIYGWMVHTRFFVVFEEANQAFEEMKADLARIYDGIPLNDDPQFEVRMEETVKAISEFVERFP